MYYARHIPPPPLCDFVEFIWCLSEGPTHTAERILPGGTAELVINLRDNEIEIADPQRRKPLRRLSGAVVSGPYSHAFDINASRHTAMLGVHFKPAGAQVFLHTPSCELLDTHVELEELWNDRADRLRSRVCEARSQPERFAIVESALMSTLRPGLTLRPDIATAMSELQTGISNPPIGDLAGRAGLSHRHFIKEFITGVGMSPKLFSRVRRFHRAVGRVDAGERLRWSELAVECGYADQAHMIREFQAFCGLTPGQYLRRRQLETKEDHVAIAA